MTHIFLPPAISRELRWVSLWIYKPPQSPSFLIRIRPVYSESILKTTVPFIARWDAELISTVLVLRRGQVQKDSVCLSRQARTEMSEDSFVSYVRLLFGQCGENPESLFGQNATASGWASELSNRRVLSEASTSYDPWPRVNEACGWPLEKSQ